jgi:hypothetical protein
MRKLIELDSVAAVEEVARRIVVPGISIVTSRRGFAGNDADYEDSAKVAEAWARHAFAANGFGEAAITGAISAARHFPANSARPTGYELHHAARAHRSFTLGEIIVAMIQAIGDFARRVRARSR